MNFISDNTIKISVIVYIIIVTVLVYLKPDIFYVNNQVESKKLKIFGTGSRKHKTIFPLWFALIILAIIIYSMICLVANKL